MRFALNLAREADRRLAHWRSDARAVLINSRTAMNYAIVRPICKAMRDDRRVRFYFTSSEQPANLAEVYAEAGDVRRLLHPRRAMPQRHSRIARHLNGAAHGTLCADVVALFVAQCDGRNLDRTVERRWLRGHRQAARPFA